MSMTRKKERELREVRAILDTVDGVLENWGIEMHRYDNMPGVDDREPSERFAAQIGEDEAVEYNEVYGLICDVALETYAAGRRVTDVPLLAEYRPLRAEIDDLPRDRTIPVTEDAWKREHAAYEGSEDYSELSKRQPRPVVVEWVDPTETPSETMMRFHEETQEAWAEVARLRAIIEQAYSSQSWEIGIVKNALVAGLPGYEKSGWAERSKEIAAASHAHAHQWSAPMGRPRAIVCQCGASRMVDDSYERTDAELSQVGPRILVAAEEFEVGFDEESDYNSWWITLDLVAKHGHRLRYTMTDIDAEQLIIRLQDQITDGRKDFNE